MSAHRKSVDLHPLQLAQAAHKFYKDLLRFVQDGMRDTLGQPQSTALPLLAGALAERATNSAHLFPNKPLAFTQEILNQGYTLMHEKYLRWVGQSFLGFDADPADFVFLPPYIASVTQTQDDEEGSERQVELDPTEKAFQVAVQNRRLTQSRQVALHFLLSEARGDRSASDALEAEVRDADVLLNNQLTRYTVSWLMFGTLLGGETLAQVRAEILNERFSEDSAVMCYLEPGEHLPYGWSGDSEDMFRGSVAGYANRPIG